jgi:hypothetical protein
VKVIDPGAILEAMTARNTCFLFIILQIIVLFKLLTVGKQWWMEICASQSSGG